MNQAVTDYISNISQPWQAEISTKLRELVHEAVPSVEERIQYGKPHFLKKGKYAAVMGTAKEWVTFTIFNASELQAPDGFFEDGPPDRKSVKIRQGQTVDYEKLSQLLKQASDTI